MPSHQESLVILLHGVGANGANLVALGEALEGFLPDAVFVSPDAPQPVRRRRRGPAMVQRRRRQRRQSGETDR